MAIVRDATVRDLIHEFEASLPPADLVLMHDKFDDGLFHGWRPTHFGADVPGSPISVETDYPFAGLFLATPDNPYRSIANGNRVSTWKGLSGRFPATGILSVSALVAVQSAGPSVRTWTNFGLLLDIQNWHDTQRATPTWLCADGGAYPARPQLQIADDSGTYHSVTGLTNPVTGSTVSSTQFLWAGDNEAKWVVNYVRHSYDLGNLFTADSGLTSRYYESCLNGYRFDLRSQGFGKGAYNAPQTGATAYSFGGGLNVGVQLNKSSSANNAARMVVGDIKLTYHAQGWLS